jgi:hypothetical protein
MDVQPFVALCANDQQQESCQRQPVMDYRHLADDHRHLLEQRHHVLAVRLREQIQLLIEQKRDVSQFFESLVQGGHVLATMRHNLPPSHLREGVCLTNTRNFVRGRNTHHFGVLLEYA